MSTTSDRDKLLESYDYETLGDDPAEFDEWLDLYDKRESDPTA